MAIRAGDLAEPRHLERLRTEIVEVISANLAYPPYYDFRTNSLRTRPIDRAKVAEIEQFIGSANFAVIEQAAPSSPETRRFVERLMLRYLEVNPSLMTPSGARYQGSLRAQAARLATEIHRRFSGYVVGQERDFGTRRQAASWAAVKRSAQTTPERAEHSSRLLEAGLKEPASARVAQSAKRPAVSPASGATSSAQIPQASQSSIGIFGPFASAGPPPSAPVVPQPAPAIPDEPDLIANRANVDLSDQPTGPVAAVIPTLPAYGRPANAPGPAGQSMREVPVDLLNLYGSYLGDMEPEARGAVSTPPQPARAPVASPTSKAKSAEGRNDILIFYQLRYQLEAYVRWAARSYGLPGFNGDPAGLLDDLRRSGFVDEADLRIAEGVFALAERVTIQGQATLEDYRQAMMLYLLYHRSHLPS